MNIKLPGGFSPVNAVKQIGSYAASPVTGSVHDYDVYSDWTRKGTEGNNIYNLQPQQGSGANRTAVLGATNSIPNQFPGLGQNPIQTGGGGGGGGAGGGAGGGGATYNDPYAKFGGQANYNALVNSFNTSQANAQKGYNTKAGQLNNQYQNDLNAFLRQYENTQGEINRGNANNQLNLRASMNNIIQGIQQGLRSGGVALAGMNAGDSGATEALARAYAQVGNNQTGEARGQANTVFEDLQRQQGALVADRDEQMGAFGRTRDQGINTIRNEFSSELDKLNADSQLKGLDWRANQGLVNQVVDNALAKLQSLDQRAQGRLNNAQAWDQNKIMQEARRLEEAGHAGNAFGVTGGNLNVPGAASSPGQMPIYARGRDEQFMAPGRDDERR